MPHIHFFSCSGIFGATRWDIKQKQFTPFFCPRFLVSKKCLTFILFLVQDFLVSQIKPRLFSCPGFLARLGGTSSKKKITPFLVQDFCPGFLVSKKMLHLHFFFSGIFWWLVGTPPSFFCPKFLVRKKCLTFIFFLSGIFGKQKNASPSCFLVQDFW